MKQSTVNKLNKIADRMRVIMEELETIRDNANDDYSEKSERWQESERGEHFSAMISVLDEAIGSTDTAISEIEGISIFE